MDMIVVSGFLGAGKTSLCRQLIGELQHQGLRVAVLVNEIGEIGLDGAKLAETSEYVWELSNGCICCSLAQGVETALRQIVELGRIDAVVIEPSGASLPQGIRGVLGRWTEGKADRLCWIALLDAARIEPLLAVAEPLIEAQTTGADVIFLTKADLATPQQLAIAESFASRVCPRTPCHRRNNSEAPVPPLPLTVGSRHVAQA